MDIIAIEGHLKSDVLSEAIEMMEKSKALHPDFQFRIETRKSKRKIKLRRSDGDQD